MNMQWKENTILYKYVDRSQYMYGVNFQPKFSM